MMKQHFEVLYLLSYLNYDPKLTSRKNYFKKVDLLLS